MRVFRKQLISAAVAVSAITVLLTGSAVAHVVVKPAEVLTGAFQTFNMGVPNEKDIPTMGLKLLIPDGLQHVSPTVKPGWTIAVEKEGTGEDAKIKSITWTGGSIPAGQRDDFTFSAKTPGKESDLQWKAYQTYEDGEVVAWDQDPSKSKDHDSGKPFSVTKVASKITSADVSNTQNSDSENSTDATAKSLGFAALAVSLLALAVATRKPATKKK